MSQKELDDLKAHPATDSTADPIDDLLARTAALVRGYCRANGQVILSKNPDEIPESLISPAMDYAAFDILKRLPGGMSDERKDARDQAIALFDKVARNEVTPESADANDEQSNGARPRFLAGRRERLNLY